MIDVEQHVMQEAAKQVAELGQCRGKGIHCIDWQSVNSGILHSPFSKMHQVLTVVCTQCGMIVRIPQFIH